MISMIGWRAVKFFPYDSITLDDVIIEITPEDDKTALEVMHLINAWLQQTASKFDNKISFELQNSSGKKVFAKYKDRTLRIGMGYSW